MQITILIFQVLMLNKLHYIYNHAVLRDQLLVSAIRIYNYAI